MGKVVISAIGSRGDIRPVLEYAKNLKSCGDEVAFIAPPENEVDVVDAGLQFFSIGISFDSKESAAPLSDEELQLQFELYHDLYQWADRIYGVGKFYAGRSISELFNKNYSHIFYSPQWIPSPLISPPGARSVNSSKMTNRSSWRSFFRNENRCYKRTINRCRTQMGLPSIKSVYKSFIDVPILMMLDRQLYDMSRLSWPSLKQIDFPIYQNSVSTVSEKSVKRFRQTHEKTALISFGSARQDIKDRKAYYKEICEALYYRGFYCVILDEKIPGVPNSEFQEYLSFSDYLQYFDLVVHHGGIGTSMAAVQNQVPQIILPQTMDQFFWADVFAKKNLAVGLKKTIQIPLCLDQHVLVQIRNAQKEYAKNSARNSASLNQLPFKAPASEVVSNSFARQEEKLYS